MRMEKKRKMAYPIGTRLYCKGCLFSLVARPLYPDLADIVFFSLDFKT